MPTREIVLNGRLHQIEVYPEVTPLNTEEREWLSRHSTLNQVELANDPLSRKLLFERLWTGMRTCKTCHRSEGQCNNRDCIRVRVTNKLHLNDWKG